MLVIGHKAPMEVSAIACRIESLNQRRRAGSLSKFLGPSDVVLTPSQLVTRYSIDLYSSVSAHAQRPPRGGFVVC